MDPAAPPSPEGRVELFPWSLEVTAMRHSNLSSDPFVGLKFTPRPKVLTPVERARKAGTAALIKLMAKEMVDQRALKGDCSVTDLRMAGFTLDEIDGHGMAARQQAMRTVREAA